MAEPSNLDEKLRNNETVAERILRSLRTYGVKYLFANFGSDHPPFIEAIERVHANGDEEAIPSLVVCPHEFATMSIAHGYASATGEPQAVLIHVDVGTQNLGAAMHNAHRGNAPVFVFAGLAPLAHGDHPGSRKSWIHYIQDMFDQTGMFREYCRWAREYRLPADPAEFVSRGLERATGFPPGPVYMSATLEALAAPVPESHSYDGKPRRVRGSEPDAETIDHLVDLVRTAKYPVVVTSYLGQPPKSEEKISSLVSFAETAGAGVVEHASIAQSFPRDHDLHIGFDPSSTFEVADLVIVADAAIPWTHMKRSPADDATIVQIDMDPTKDTYPSWSFSMDETIVADAAKTLAAVSEKLDPSEGSVGREYWRSVAEERRSAAVKRVEKDRTEDRLSAGVVGAIIDEIAFDDNTIVVEDAVTSGGKIREQIEPSQATRYIRDGTSGLGWGTGAAIGVKLAHPTKRVISIMGDGGYLFSQPTSCAWISAVNDAPTLTVVLDNEGWKAVQGSTTREYPDGAAVSAGIPESRFEKPLDLTAPASAVDAYTKNVADEPAFRTALQEGVTALDNGRPGVIVVEITR